MLRKNGCIKEHLKDNPTDKKVNISCKTQAHLNKVKRYYEYQ